MRFEKKDFPLIRVREHLETGPIVLVTSHHEGHSNIMTMGWHTMMQFSPALLGCYIWDGNRSHSAIRESRECVINRRLGRSGGCHRQQPCRAGRQIRGDASHSLQSPAREGAAH